MTTRPANVAPAPASASLLTSSTPWLSVFLAVGAGMLAAFQVGKVHIALPSIRASFSLSLLDSSWILSALSVVGIFFAALTGSFAARIGTRATTILGLVFIAASSAAGGYSPSAAWLVWSRLFEGIGFVMVVVAAPSLIVEIASRKDVRIALAWWSCFMPGGIALITFLAPLLLAHHGWRTLWFANAFLLLAFALLFLACVSRRGDATPRLTPSHPFADLRAVMTARGPMLLAIIFCTYTLQHLAVMGFMPTILIEKFKVSPATAGLLVSIAMASNILGNLAAGLLLQRGVRRAFLIGAASIFMAAMTVGMFSLGLPLVPVYICAFLFSCVGGLVPSSVLGSAPFHSPTERLIPATNGLLVQGSNLGIVLGPPLLSGLVTALGWRWVPLLTVVAAALATALASALSYRAHSRQEVWTGISMH